MPTDSGIAILNCTAECASHHCVSERLSSFLTLRFAGNAGAGLGEISPSAAEDSQVPSVVEDVKEKASGKGFFGFLAPKSSEVASVSEAATRTDNGVGKDVLGGAAGVADKAADLASKPVQVTLQSLKIL